MSKLISFPYIGGKTFLSSKIISFIEKIPHFHYVEVFGGAANVLLNKNPSKLETYNDIDNTLVNFFRVVRDPHKQKILAHRLNFTLRSRKEFNDCKDRLFSNKCEDDIDKAFCFYVCITQCFGPFISSKDKITWSYSITSHRKRKDLNLTQRLLLLKERLVGVQIENDDFRNIIKRYDSDKTLFYLDPPYFPSTCDIDLYENTMSEEDHLQMLNLIANSSGKFIISGYTCKEYEDILETELNFRRYEYASRMSCSGLKSSRKNLRTECLWIRDGDLKTSLLL